MIARCIDSNVCEFTFIMVAGQGGAKLFTLHAAIRQKVQLLRDKWRQKREK